MENYKNCLKYFTENYKNSAKQFTENYDNPQNNSQKIIRILWNNSQRIIRIVRNTSQRIIRIFRNTSLSEEDIQEERNWELDHYCLIWTGHGREEWRVQITNVWTGHLYRKNKNSKIKHVLQMNLTLNQMCILRASSVKISLI